MGFEKPFMHAPWFWSDQYDVNLRVVGRVAGYDRAVVRGDVENYKFSVFYFKNGKFVAADSVNRVKDHVIARKVLDRGVELTPSQAADIGFDLGSLVKDRPRVRA